MENELLVFVKNPVAGKVKTRLARDIGNENALEIYRKLLNHTAAVAREVEARKSIYFSDRISREAPWNHTGFECYTQRGADLGIRMENAFREAFERSSQKVVIVGSDLYDLDVQILQEAYAALEHNDIVIGPAKDGGYYLLGLKFLPQGIFRNKDWGTPAILEATLKDLTGYDVALLGELNDIDLLEDLKMHPELMNLIHDEKHGKTT